MKFFDPKKKQEPEAFRAWKRQELPALIALCKKRAGRALYNELQSNLPREPEEGIHYYSKKQLVQTLLEEQGFLCCYCNRSFDLQAKTEEQAEFPIEVEHISPIEYEPKRALDYSNLMASCSEGRKEKRNENMNEKRRRSIGLTCNAARKSMHLPITPQQPDCESRILYGENGDVFGADEEATTTINLLNLKKFDKARGKIIEGWIYEPNSNLLIDKINAEQIVETLRHKQNGKYIPYCSAIIQVIQREILQRL